MQLLTKKPLLTIALLLVSCNFLYAQQSEEKLLEEVRTAYNQLNYEEAEIKANAALSNYQRFTPTQLTEIHKILGIIYFSQNRAAEAKQQFENALSLTPQLSLDPLYVSPKIIEFFNEVKQGWQTKTKEKANSEGEIRYLVMQDPRPAAAMRSMLLPGWGQTYKGQRSKGRVLMALWGVGVVGSLVAHIKRQDAEDKYLSERDPGKIQSRFNTFDTFHKVRNSLLIFSAGVWIYSYVDALLSHSRTLVESSVSNKQVRLLPIITRSSSRVHLQIDF